MALYLVDSISMFRMRYVVDCDSATEAELLVKDHLTDDQIKEFSQHHIGEPVTGVRKLGTEAEYLELFDEDNDYLADWPVDKKLNYINRFDLEETTDA
jgi:hypothetical protein